MISCLNFNDFPRRVNPDAVTAGLIPVHISVRTFFMDPESLFSIADSIVLRLLYVINYRTFWDFSTVLLSGVLFHSQLTQFPAAYINKGMFLN